IHLDRNGGRDYSDDAAVPAAARERAGGRVAALSAPGFLRAVFRGRERGSRPAQRRADETERRTNVRRAVSRGAKLYRETDQGRKAGRDLRSNERAAAGTNRDARYHPNHQRGNGERTRFVRGKARELSGRDLRT